MFEHIVVPPVCPNRLHAQDVRRTIGNTVARITSASAPSSNMDEPDKLSDWSPCGDQEAADEASRRSRPGASSFQSFALQTIQQII